MKRTRCARRGFLQTSAVVASWLAAPGASRGMEPTRVEPTRDVPWLAEIKQPPAKLPGDGPKLTPLLGGEDGEEVTTVGGWQRRREAIRHWWLDFLGPMPAERKQAPALEVVAEDRVEGVLRQLVRYEVEPGLKTEGYLLKPARLMAKAPGIVVFHSTVNYTIRQPAGLEGPPEKHFGLRYAKKGCVCFCPRNFLWPEISAKSLKAPAEAKSFLDRKPGSTGMGKMLHDGLVAVDVLAAQPEVDALRLGAVGHSLGAKEALYIAAFDERIKATVSSEGGIGTRFSNWDATWYLGPAIKAPSFTHEHHELLALAAPRPFLLVGGNSADGDQGWPFIAAALPVYELYGKPARLGQFNHGQGHAVPPLAEARIEEWLLTYLAK